MTRDDIIRMAREAGFATSWTEAAGEALERFAELVAAAEREACAMLAYEFGEPYVGASLRESIASAIRSKGEREPLRLTHELDTALLRQALDALEAALSDDQPYLALCKETVTVLRVRLEGEQ